MSNLVSLAKIWVMARPNLPDMQPKGSKKSTVKYNGNDLCLDYLYEHIYFIVIIVSTYKALCCLQMYFNATIKVFYCHYRVALRLGTLVSFPSVPSSHIMRVSRYTGRPGRRFHWFSGELLCQISRCALLCWFILLCKVSHSWSSQRCVKRATDHICAAVWSSCMCTCRCQLWRSQRVYHYIMIKVKKVTSA